MTTHDDFRSFPLEKAMDDEFCPVCGTSQTEVARLKEEIKRLQGNFSHFHICNHINDECALCGLPVENEVHLRSR